MDKSLGTLLHFWGVFQFTQVQPLPSPNKQFWTRVSRIISEFQLCIGRGRKNCKKMSKRMHCFKRKPRNERKIWILQYCPGLLSRIVATASAILPYATSTFPIITLFAPRKILHKHCFQIWGGGEVVGANKVHYGKCGSGVQSVFIHVASIYENSLERKKALA